MNLAAFSFRDLEYIVAVANHLHFGKAALACSISQPTLSTQLRKVEEYVGFEIFERTGRNVLVTDRGLRIVEQAQIVLNEGRRLCEIAQGGGDPLTGTFRLGMIGTLGPYLTPLLLQPVREKFPRLRLILTEGLTQHLAHALDAGEIDAMLGAPPLRGDFNELPLFQEDLVLAVPREHPLATSQQVALADVDPRELILLNEGHCLRARTLAPFPGLDGNNDSHTLRAASLESMRQMVGAGLGCALLPRLAVQIGTLLDDMVAYRMIRDDPPRRTISMFHRSSFGRIREARALRDLIREALRGAGTVTVLDRPRREAESVGTGTNGLPAHQRMT